MSVYNPNDQDAILQLVLGQYASGGKMGSDEEEVVLTIAPVFSFPILLLITALNPSSYPFLIYKI